MKICLDHGSVHPFLVPSPGNQFRTIIHNLSNNFAYQVFGAVAGDCLSFRQAFGPVTSVPSFDPTTTPSFWRRCRGLFEFGQLTVHLVAQIR